MAEYLRNNPTTPDAVHFRDFVNHGAWEMYLRRMAMDGEWGDWIALLGLINMLNIPVSIVSAIYYLMLLQYCNVLWSCK